MIDVSVNITQGIHHLGLTVPDITKTAEFFLQHLKFYEVGRKPDYPAIFVSDGTVVLTLWQARNPQSAVPFSRHDNIGLHHFALKVVSMEALQDIHKKFLALDEVSVEFAPEPLGNTAITHMMCIIPGGIRVEFIVL